jgi:flagellar capping protein FliD
MQPHWFPHLLKSKMMEYTEYIPEDSEEVVQAERLAAKKVIEREMIDSLPYIDYYDDQAEALAKSLVDAELRTFPNPHTAAPVSLNFTSDALIADAKRLEATNGAGWTAPLPVFDFPTPDPDAGLAEWQAAVERAKIVYEYLKNRLELMELQQQFGANSWLAHNQIIEKARDHFKNLLLSFKSKIEQINIQRKMKQLQQKTKLTNMEAAFLETSKQNSEIEAACIKLEQELGIAPQSS